MSDQPLTKIFPPDVLPMSNGVYKTRGIDPETGNHDDGWLYSYFDSTDRVWGCSHATVEEAFKSPEYEFASQSKEWCHLTGELTA